MAKNIRYRGAVQPIPQYEAEVKANQKVADREYDGIYRGEKYHHDANETAEMHKEQEHKVQVTYRGAHGVTLVN